MTFKHWVKYNTTELVLLIVAAALLGLVGWGLAWLAQNEEMLEYGQYSKTCYAGFVFVKHTQDRLGPDSVKVIQLIGQDGKPVTCVEKEGTK